MVVDRQGIYICPLQTAIYSTIWTTEWIQWEQMLLCNTASHWLGATTDSTRSAIFVMKRVYVILSRCHADYLWNEVYGKPSTVSYYIPVHFHQPIDVCKVHFVRCKSRRLYSRKCFAAGSLSRNVSWIVSRSWTVAPSQHQISNGVNELPATNRSP